MGFIGTSFLLGAINYRQVINQVVTSATDRQHIFGQLLCTFMALRLWATRIGSRKFRHMTLALMLMLVLCLINN